MPSTFIRHTVSARAVAVASRNTITRNHAQRFMAGRVSHALDRVMHKYPSARSVAYFWSFLARAEIGVSFIGSHRGPAVAPTARQGVQGDEVNRRNRTEDRASRSWRDVSGAP